MDIRQVKMSELKMGPIRDQVLPTGFIERVRKYKAILGEVEPMTLEETVANFQRDKTPETELMLWEHIASIYQWSIVANSGLSFEQKKEVLSLLLALSMGMKDFSNIKKLTKETIDEIVDRYQYE